MRLKQTVVEWARSRRAGWAGGRDGSGSGGPNSLFPCSACARGAVRSLGIPMTNGYIDYLTLLNARDGGITA